MINLPSKQSTLPTCYQKHIVQMLSKHIFHPILSENILWIFWRKKIYFVNVMMCSLLIVLLLEAISDLDVLLNGMDGRLIRLLIITSRTLQSRIWVTLFKTSQGNSLRPLEKSSFQNRTHTGEKSYPKQHPHFRHKTLNEKIYRKLISDHINVEVKPCKWD